MSENSTPPPPADRLVLVGNVGGAFGVRGEVRLKSFCAQPEAIVAYAPLFAADGRCFDVTLGRAIKGGFSVRLSGVLTKEDADALKGLDLFAPRNRLPSLPDDEFYHADLIGLEVVDTGGVVTGRVKSVINNGADDLLEVHGPNLKGTVLVPFTKACVPTVDLDTGRLVIDPPDGLF